MNLTLDKGLHSFEISDLNLFLKVTEDTFKNLLPWDNFPKKPVTNTKLSVKCPLDKGLMILKINDLFFKVVEDFFKNVFVH